MCLFRTGWLLGFRYCRTQFSWKPTIQKTLGPEQSASPSVKSIKGTNELYGKWQITNMSRRSPVPLVHLSWSKGTGSAASRLFLGLRPIFTSCHLYCKEESPSSPKRIFPIEHYRKREVFKTVDRTPRTANRIIYVFLLWILDPWRFYIWITFFEPNCGNSWAGLAGETPTVWQIFSDKP